MMNENDRSVPPVDSAARTVVAVFDEREQGDAAVTELQRQGWPAEAISVAHRYAGQPASISSEATKSGQGAATGAAIGGAAGLALGLGALLIPGIGPLLAAGPLAAALAGAAAGAGTGGMLGSFVGLGIPEPEARHYEDEVRRGGYFVSVRTDDTDAASRLEAMLSSLGARAVTSYDQRL